MGYNSVLVVLNDRLNEIERDPEFGKKVRQAILEHGMPKHLKGTYVTGQTQVISVEHADVLQVVAVGANTGRLIGRGHWTQKDEELIEYLYQELQERRRHEQLIRRERKPRSG